MVIEPQTPLDRVLGKRTAAKLDKDLGLTTAKDLLDHLPRRWVAYGQLSSFADLVEGEHVSFVAEVTGQSERRMQRRRGTLVEVTVADQQGRSLRMAFFQGYQAKSRLKAGTSAVFHGKVGSYGGQLTLNNPDFEVIAAEEGAADAQAELRQGPMPLYPATLGVSSPTIRRSVEILLDAAAPQSWPDPVPESAAAQHGLPRQAEAYRLVHRPDASGEHRRGLDYFRFQEALLLQGVRHRQREAAEAVPAAAYPPHPDGVLSAFDAGLPFALTRGQQQVGEALAADLSGESPMNRLLQGEVGSGKTLVALRAMLQVVDGHGQAVLIAPTEVLAAQHERSLRRMLGERVGVGLLGPEASGASVQITLLTGSMPATARKQALLDIASGAAGIVIGTHTVLQETVSFAELGLVVVDEQHRFGVDQRNALRQRHTPSPHMLVMSATPIPRSVAMAVFGDLELTALEGLPGGRHPVTTHLAPISRGPQWVDRVWQRLAETAAAGHQAYVVCPKITDTEDPDNPAASVERISSVLAEHPATAGLRRAELHGQMSAERKEQVMGAFERGQVDVLISTTVIEVGVDVPNASLMVILDADSFGVSTLHQLRGRIGRGSTEENLCLLVTRQPEDHPSLERLHDVAASSEGMELARLDLARRREGDILGASQTGRSHKLKLLSVIEHEQVIAQAEESIRVLTAEDPAWDNHPVLRDAVQEWLEELGGGMKEV
ncbi:ATP-dependent DNA helicase RecG [Nesterenkonia populi]|uniref:ATP-dependent DNA helicase RecG n=1 Tax=Nesterenkonia populi TaxID=1591087 RepID=UPI0011BF0B39|nr:ATP-dependent DNA helicase RecG [Nesterenkonia populi]